MLATNCWPGERFAPPPEDRDVKSREAIDIKAKPDHADQLLTAQPTDTEPLPTAELPQIGKVHIYERKPVNRAWHLVTVSYLEDAELMKAELYVHERNLVRAAVGALASEHLKGWKTPAVPSQI